MTMLKPAQIRDMADDELKAKQDALRKELFELRTEIKSGRAEKPHRVSQAKKELARLLTVIRERKA